MTLELSRVGMTKAREKGISVLELSRLLSISKSTVMRAERAYKIPLSIGKNSNLDSDRVSEIEADIQDLNAEEQVEHLLFVLRAMFEDNQDPEFGMTQKEYQFFKYLKSRIGKTVNKEQIYNALYASYDSEVQIKIIDVFACKLRRKLPSHLELETVWGIGYKLMEVDNA